MPLREGFELNHLEDSNQFTHADVVVSGLANHFSHLVQELAGCPKLRRFQDSGHFFFRTLAGRFLVLVAAKSLSCFAVMLLATFRTSGEAAFPVRLASSAMPIKRC